MFESTINEFFRWLQTTAAKDEAFKWFLATVVLSGSLFSAQAIVRAFFGYFYNVFRSDTYFRDTRGTFYLYHPPLIINFSKIPRVSKFRIFRGWLVPAKAEQTDANDRRKKIYGGNIQKIKIGFTVCMQPEVGEGEKMIIAWDFQKRNCDQKRVAVGAMSSISYHDEPYRVPIILSEIHLPRSTVEAVLKILAKSSTITREIRRASFELMDVSPVGTDEDQFEHMTTPSAPVRSQTSRYSRLAGLIGIRL